MTICPFSFLFIIINHLFFLNFNIESLRYIVFIIELCVKFELKKNNLNSQKTYLSIIKELNLGNYNS